MVRKPLDVLVVEDEPDQRELIRIGFSCATDAGILAPEPNLTIVENGHQALRKAQDYRRFDVVVSDYRLRGALTGLQ